MTDIYENMFLIITQSTLFMLEFNFNSRRPESVERISFSKQITDF